MTLANSKIQTLIWSRPVGRRRGRRRRRPYRVVWVATLVPAETIEPLRLITDATSEFRVLVADTVTTSSVAGPIDASRAIVDNRLPELFELALREHVLVPNLLADLAFHPFFLKRES